MSVSLSLFAGAGAQFLDNNGNLLSGGKIYTYQAGTTTPLTTYTSNTGNTPHTNPIVLDSAGRVPSGGEIWLTLGIGYKFIVRTSAEVLIATYDNIPSSAQPPAANDADSIMYEQGYTVTAGSFVIGKMYRIASVGTTDFTLIGAVNNVVGTHFIATGVGSGTGTAELSRSVEAKLRETVSVKDFGAVGDGVTDDTAAFNSATAAKTQQTVLYSIPVGTYPITTQQSLTGYFQLLGSGDQSQVKISSGTAFAYTSQTGVFDDHSHNLAENFRITGNGVFASYPNAQTGTTTGLSFAVTPNIGSFASSQGMTFELHDTGKYVKQSYVHFNNWNHYRANKIGLKLEAVTSFTESNSYFRYNSTAAIQILGGQNITISGGAIEGNPGVGIQYTPSGSTLSQININDVYFESNGNEATGVWSIDVPFNSQTVVNVNGGNLWRNTASGVSSGPYRFGDNAIIDGSTINGSLYVKYARVRNTRGNVVWNSFSTESLARLFELTEPTVMLEYTPANQTYDFSAASGGAIFASVVQGKGSVKTPGVTDIGTYTYPYSFSASGGATSSANATLNYGEGDFFRVQYAASTGNFSSNYATIGSFPDVTKPYRVSCVLFYPESDCEIGIVQSVGNQATTGYYALKANTYYRMIILAYRPMTAGSFLRVFPISSAGPAINYFPIWASQHATHAEQLGIVQKLVDGVL